MRSLASLFVAIMLGGCAYTPVVRLTMPPLPERLPDAAVVVDDGRAYRQLSISTVNGNLKDGFLLAPVPPIDEALRLHLRALVALEPVERRPELSISMKTVDVIMRGAYFEADKLTCTMVSTVQVGGVAREVKTVSTLDGTVSVFAATAAQKALDKCLPEHAAELLEAAAH